MAKKKFEEYLAPWEVDDSGKKLDEPAEVDPEKLKKYIFNLLSDKEDLQEKVVTIEGERDTAISDLATVRQEHENEEQRRSREEKEREERYAKMEKKELERQKLEAIEEHFADQGITSARAKRLAKRITSTDEKDWIKEADELVEDGFRITDATTGKQDVVEEPQADDLETRPKVRRSNGSVVVTADKKNQTIGDELDKAGIFSDVW